MFRSLWLTTRCVVGCGCAMRRRVSDARRLRDSVSRAQLRLRYQVELHRIGTHFFIDDKEEKTKNKLFVPAPSTPPPLLGWVGLGRAGGRAGREADM